MIMLAPYHLRIHTFPMKHEDNDSEIRIYLIVEKRIDAICGEMRWRR